MSRAAAPPERFAGLDALRGLAVAGIGLVNVPLMGSPSAWPGPLTGADAVVADATHWLLDRKLVTVFSLLFGASLVLMQRRVAGAAFDRRFAARLRGLAVLGALHGALVWKGDILLHYAIVGSLALRLRRLGRRELVVLAGACLLGSALVRLGLEVIPAVTWDAMAQPRLDPMHAGAIGALGRAEAFARQSALALVAWGPWTLGLFGLGMAAAGDPRLAAWARGQGVARPTLACLGVGAALHVGLGWLGSEHAASRVAFDVAGLVLGLGYAGVVVWAMGRGHRWCRALVPLGRLALSAYLLQSVLGVAAGAMLGLGPHERVAWLGVSAAVLAVELGAAHAWITRRGRGPVEAWLHRRQHPVGES